MRTERVAKKKAAKKKTSKKVVQKKAKGLDPMGVQVRAVMTRRVKTVRPDTSLELAMDLMMSKEISHLPVTDGNGRLVGILSKTDLVRRFFMDGDSAESEARSARRGIEDAYGPGFHLEPGRTVSEVMSKRVRTVADDASLAEAAGSMSKLKIHGLPVVSADQALVGFLSTFDIVGWVATP